MLVDNGQVLEIYERLNDLIQKKISFPAKVAYAIVRNFRTITPIVEDIDSIRRKIIESYAEPIEDKPGMYKAQPGKEQQMSEEIESLNTTTNEIELYPIKLDDIENLDLTLDDMQALYPLLQHE